jgi:hypothetical protein
MITLDFVKEILNNGGIAYPYPRLKQISINGSRGRIATPEAIRYCVTFYKNKYK